MQGEQGALAGRRPARNAHGNLSTISLIVERLPCAFGLLGVAPALLISLWGLAVVAAFMLTAGAAALALGLAASKERAERDLPLGGASVIGILLGFANLGLAFLLLGAAFFLSVLSAAL